MRKTNLSRLDAKNATTYILGIVLCGVLAIGMNWAYELRFREITHLGLSTPRIVIFFGVLAFLYLHFVFSPEKIYGYLFRHRFVLGAALFAVCVALKLHGSSIGVWNNYIASAPSPSPYQFPILGVPRPIRSDEWVVFTPLAMSQQYTGYAAVNDIACAWPTNMLTTYNQPVWDLTAIAKPFYWGYLLLGSEYGLSWFWCGRLIALFLVTFEMFLLITGQKKRYALSAAFLITFSAFVQWWFAINFLVEMLVWGQLAELMLYRFLNTDSTKTKLLCTGVFTFCALGYLFALYPAWMIPLFYLFAAIALWILLENFSHGRRSIRELVYPAATLLVVGIMAGYWLSMSADAISVTMNTVYPGARNYTGGDGWDHLFFYINNLFLPYSPVPNSCEPAMLYGFFPFTEILVAVYLVKTRFRDRLLTLLAVLDGCFLVLFLFGVPAFLTKITLLYLTSNRISPIICLIEVILFLRLLSVEDEPLVKERRKRFALLGGLCVLAGLFVWEAKNRIPPDVNPEEGLQLHYCLVMVLIIGAYCTYFLVRRTKSRKTAFTLAAVTLSLATGLWVNPLMRTVDAIYDKPLAKAVQTIQDEAPGIWIAADRVHPNFLICNGAPTVNSVNIIPTLERWALLDESGVYADIYNRYAHFYTAPAEETRFEMGTNDDWFTLYITLEDLHTLGVRYLVMPSWQEFPTEEYSLGTTPVYTDSSLTIYALKSTEAQK